MYECSFDINGKISPAFKREEMAALRELFIGLRSVVEIRDMRIYKITPGEGLLILEAIQNRHWRADGLLCRAASAKLEPWLRASLLEEIPRALQTG